MAGRASVAPDAHLEHTADHLRTGDLKALQSEGHLDTIVQGGQARLTVKRCAKMMNQSQVEVSLRAVSQHDLEIFFEQQLEPEATAMAGFPARDHDAHMAHWRKILADESNITRTILANGEVAGNIGSWIGDGERDIGYWIGKRFWGKGVATAAVKQFLKLVQERPLYAWVARHNHGSIRVLEKAGFGYDREGEDDVVYKIA